MTYILAEVQYPSPFTEVLIARLATGLKSTDHEPFRLAAESVLAALPAAMLGDAVYRTVEPVWHRYFYPRACGGMAWDDGARNRGSKLIEEGMLR